MSGQWIIVRNWPKFQHYGNDRPLHWIKDHLSQHDDDEYMELSLALRGLLKDLRCLYARRRGILPKDPARITRALNVRVTGRQLEALNQAGFIEFSSSKPLALAGAGAGSLEKEKEKNPQTPAERGPRKSKRRAVDGRKLTGFKFVRGSHSGTYVPDPNGTDTPPYPVPKETR